MMSWSSIKPFAAGQRASTAVPLTPPSHLSADARRIIRAVALRSSTSASTSNASAPAVSAAAGNGAQRPFLPQIDPQAVLSTLFDDKPALEGTLSSFIATDGGPPRLFSPMLPRGETLPPRSSLPLMFYLPGIDGTGLAAHRQFASLTRAFDLRALSVPPSDRTPFEELVDRVCGLVRAEVEASSTGRPVYLLGESFGGILALAVADRCRSHVDRVVLVNPATSFPQSAWPAAGPLLSALPDAAYKLLPFAIMPLIGNPVAMALAGVNLAQPTPAALSDAAYSAINMLPELAALRVVLPADTLQWKLQLLRTGSTAIEPRLPEVQQRVLLVAGENDLLIPSAEEAKRLARKLPRCNTRVLPGRSHALLQEAGVDLVSILKEEGFYVTERRLSNAGFRKAPRAGSGSSGGVGGSGAGSSSTSSGYDATTSGSSSSTGAVVYAGATVAAAAVAEAEVVGKLNGNGTSHDTIASSASISEPHSERVAAHSGAGDSGPASTSGGGRSGANFGTAAPLELPTKQELRKATDRLLLNLKRAVSPVYYSTDANGRVQRGLGAIPSARPLLFVGNHSLLATDMPLMIEQFLEEKDMLLRGLAHPAALQGSDATGGSQFGSFLATYGAVTVSGKNIFSLLQQGEAVLLYPGGVREAYKGRGEQYQLFWPEKSEFVRMAAKFDATIVPFSVVGPDEGANPVLDARDLLSLPLVGDWLRQRTAAMPKARKGVNETMEDTDAFIAPIVTLNTPPRYYFLFQQPIATSRAMSRDKAACDETYRRVKQSVQGGFDYLLRKRQADPYKDFAPRVLYEFSRAGRKQAPSFEP